MRWPRETLAGCAGMTAGLAADCLTLPAALLLSLCSSGGWPWPALWLHLQTMPVSMAGMLLGAFAAGGRVVPTLASAAAMTLGLPWAPRLADGGVPPFAALVAAMALPMVLACAALHVLRHAPWRRTGAMPDAAAGPR